EGWKAPKEFGTQAQGPGRVSGGAFSFRPSPRVPTANPRQGRPWGGSALGTRGKPPSEPRHSDEKARNHNHHSGDEYSQARKQQKVAQEYMHTPASLYRPVCWGDHDILKSLPLV